MANFGYIICGAIITALAIFVNYPAPKLSARLLAWRNKGSFMKHQAVHIFYIDEQGTGPSRTLVCLHGFPTSSFDWVKILPKLRELFSRVVMVDFLGFGFSDKPQNHVYTIGEQADIVEELVKKLGLSEVHYLSHDYGDTVALELLARHNEKQLASSIKSLTMLNGGIFPNTHHPRPAQKLLLRPILGYIASHLYSFPLFCRGFGEIFGVHKPSKEDNEDFWALMRHSDGDKATVSVINFLRERQHFKERWVGALKNTRIEVLMIYGPADPVNPPEFAKHFKDTVPQHKLVTLSSNIGHYPQWEDPGSVDDEIACFINNLKTA